MIYNDMTSLLRGITKEMQKAMTELSDQSREIVDKELSGYYTGSPKMYKRTGMLARDGEVTPVTGDKEQVFIARLKKDYTYPSITYTYPDGSQTTSKSPTMEDVLRLTNDGATYGSVGKLHPAIGNGGYWQRIEEQIEQSLNETFGRHFN